MNKQTVTIYDVAREAEVSMATVSRVVNGNTNVKPSTREKVMKVIEKLDYRPNAVARGLASRRTTTVGVIIPDITNLYFSSFALGIDDIAAMYDYSIIMANADQGREEKVVTDILSRQVDGLVYLGHTMTDKIRHEVERTRTPIVLAGMIDPEGKMPSVHIDYESAVAEAVSRLFDQGIEDVAFISAPEYQVDDELGRFNGYKKALASHNKDLDSALCLTAENSRYRAAEEVGQELIDSKAQAAMIIGDELAAGVSNYVQDKGLKVPEDISIVSSNNSIITEIVRPQLTTIAPPLYDIGAVAMRILTKLMGDKSVEEEVIENKNILPYKIIVRDSTK
ncbi:substrate-binding domain-containing protein [Aerococcus sanguinicola]|uniref:Catabolite control protein A n=1 Tax=Aerococcus sanguinicola TaxID=119206 RepID=A0A0X8FCC5_9LACT|nr:MULTISPECIES: substrate-binding domain-containing protein [Aerococcus]AMB94662.1 catabolite control protein A [Aerococcus sanguinicola]MDK6232792.1 substrate-binding domain-containing protein [Aerococcus sp. UMB10185]MDK6805259.1 substrate-binding domain-containing protein [Aerococcus sp. UMB7834]MDK6854918.1 substrate-binding domain-containing protein [Aerococcus sp. UMB7533]MDK7050872.1 substrate-binding domain-containing protein [Aerococcus sanguinicola]